MSLTPRTIRLDLKCGNSGIAAGKKCRRGTTQQSRATKIGRSIATIAGNAAVLAGAARMGGSVFNFKEGADPVRQWGQGAALMSAGSGLKDIGKGKTGRGLKRIGAAAAGAALTEAPKAIGMYKKHRLETTRAKLERLYNGSSAKRDSVWAEGFHP